MVCSQRTLARTASVSIGNVQRATVRMVEMGALLREERGRHRVHPRPMWKGDLAKRERAEVVMSGLEIIPGGKV